MASRKKKSRPVKFPVLTRKRGVLSTEQKKMREMNRRIQKR